MKYFKIITKLLAVALIVSSCQPDERGVIFDGSGQEPLIQFEQSTANLAVIEGDGTSTVDILVDVSTVSNVERSFPVTVDVDASTADPTFYSVPATFTIAPGAYEGVLTITGNEVPSLTVDPTTLVVNLDDTDDVIVEGISSVEVDVFLVCPVPADFFVGNYELVNTQQLIGDGFSTDNVSAGTYELSVGAAQSERVFSGAVVLPAFSSFQNTVTLDLICNNLSLRGRIEFSSGSGIFHAANGQSSTYDLDDDSVIQVNYIENVNGTNGFPAVPAQFELRKQ